MAWLDDGVLSGADPDLLVILGFILTVILVGRAPILLGLFGILAFIGWVLVKFGVFPEQSGRDHKSENEGESERTRRHPQHRSQHPLETLQTRYARGEIDEAEFERRLDRILESTDAVRRGGRPRTRDRVPSAESGSDRAREPSGLEELEPDAETELASETELERDRT